MACSTTPSKYELDSEVKRLCAIDGGVKVYETVRLPPESYNKLLDNFGRLWVKRKDELSPLDEYYSENQVHYYVKGNPEMSRRLYRIARRVDGKTMGELVFYGRGGGDMPGPWHDSSYTCPSYDKVPNFESLIFSRVE
jgi:hypothetical protein